MLMYCRKGCAAASVPDLKDYGFGEKGTQAWNKVQENEAVRNNRRLRAGFTAMYQAGIRGESASAVKSDAAKYIPPSVQTAAYQAGLADAAESLAREKAAVQFVSSAGSESGLVDNEYSRKLAEEKSGTAALLSMLGKDLGVRVEIVPKVLGGSANGQYVAGKNLVQIAADADNAFEFVAAHEVTHRMQSLAPEEYRSYRDYAMRFRAQELGEEGAAALVERYRAMSEDAGVALTQEEAMDEIAADFTMRMIEDGGLFEDFAKENRSEAKKLLDALKAFVEKVKSLFRSKEAQDKVAREAYGKDMATLEECVARWQKAYDAAGKAAQNAKTAAGEGSGDGRLMLKGLSYDGKTLYADSEVYNYDFLVSQPDMVVYELPPLSEVKVEGEISREAATSLGLKNAAEIGEKRQDGTYVIVNRYTGRQIVLGKGGLNHSLNAENSGEKSSINRLRTNSRLSAIGGYVVQNAIPINGLKNKNRQANGTYAMACLTNSGNRSVVAIVTVEEHSSRVASIDYVDVTHSISGRLRKNESSRSSTREKGYGLSAAPTTAAYNISIADFLDIVNETYRSILSDDVLRHYGEERPADGYYSDRVLFQLKSVTELEQEVKELKKYAAYRKRGTSDREILASTADGSAQTEWERKRLSEYKDVMGRLETYERRLAENKAKLAKD